MDIVLLRDVALLRGWSVFGGAGCPDSVERGVGTPCRALYPVVMGDEFLALCPVGVRCWLELVRFSETCLLFWVEARLLVALSSDSRRRGIRCEVESGGVLLMSFLLCRRIGRSAEWSAECCVVGIAGLKGWVGEHPLEYFDGVKESSFWPTRQLKYI